MKAKEFGYFVTPPATPQVTKQQFDVEKMQREKEKEAECRRALRERDIPPYFDSEVAACFLSKQVCTLLVASKQAGLCCEARLSLTPSTPAVPNCCCSKGLGPYWSNPLFLIFDIRALWRSVLSARVPECQKLKAVGWTSMVKCKALTGLALRRLICI